MPDAYQRHEVAGAVLLAKELRGGRTFKVFEVRLLGDHRWPSNDDLIDHFGGSFGGEVERIGRVGKVTVNLD